MPTWISIEQEFTIYVAGFFDGEGCISINRGNHLSRVEVTIAQKDTSILQLISVKWGGKILTDKRKCSYLKFVKGDDIEKFLTSVLPYLRLRFNEAQIALAMVKLQPRGPSSGKSSNNATIVLRERLAAELQRVGDARRAFVEI